MHPELFTIPFVHLSVKSYGAMLAIGFLLALSLARYLCRKKDENPDHIANFGIWALMAGVIGARLFHVFHNWPYYRDYPSQIFAVWSGGLEFLGGFLAAFAVMIWYFRKKKLSIWKFLDILAPAMMVGLAFGRIGCFLNGCCFGAPSDLPWAIRFPTLNTHTQRTDSGRVERVPEYSIAFDYQLRPDPSRRDKPLITLPADYYQGYTDGNGHDYMSLEAVPLDMRDRSYPRPIHPGQLPPRQLEPLRDGSFRMLPVHPAQIYSSLNAFLIALILYLILTRWYRFGGQVFAWMMVLYGITRFLLESLRNSSPLEFDGLTISQNLSLILVPAGVLILVFLYRKNRGSTVAPKST